MIAPFDVVATAANGLLDVAPLYVFVPGKIEWKFSFLFSNQSEIFFSAALPDDGVVDSVVTVIDEFDNKC